MTTKSNKLKQGSCWQQKVEPYDLIVAEDTDFELRRNRVYVVLDYVGIDLIKVRNDLGVEEVYTTEHFRFYEGEPAEKIWDGGDNL